MLSHRNNGSPPRCQFFFGELTDVLSSQDLLQQAYILVSKVGFSYTDVKEMTKRERLAFLKFYTDEIQRMQG